MSYGRMRPGTIVWRCPHTHTAKLQDTGYGRIVHALVCDACEREPLPALRSDTLEAHVASIPPSARARRAEQLERAAARVLGHAAVYGRISAGLRGASSLTHTYNLLSGAAEQTARQKLAVAQKLREVVEYT